MRRNQGGKEEKEKGEQEFWKEGRERKKCR
jgi:hypothetical protein